MKTRKILFSSLLVILVSISSVCFADDPQGPPSGGHGSGGNQGAGGTDAPVGNGTWVLVSLGVAFATVKLYQARRSDVSEKEETTVM